MTKIITGLGMPYMGSKRKLANEIVGFISKRHPNAKHFYDIFGGGGAVSFIALQYPQFKTVTYNELNPAVAALLQRLIKEQKYPDKYPHSLGEILSDEFYQRVGKEQFRELVKRDDWLGGLVQTTWTFGNNQSAYLYGDENKTHVENWLVYKEEESRIKAQEHYGMSLPSIIVQPKTLTARRLKFAKYTNNYRLQQLERLQRLSQLQQDYKTIDPKAFPNDSVVYLDPPYINTASYKENGISHDELYSWVAKVEAPVYLSSYESPLKPVRAMKHRSLLKGGRTKDKSDRIEWLFWNGI